MLAITLFGLAGLGAGLDVLHGHSPVGPLVCCGLVALVTWERGTHQPRRNR